MTPGEPRTPLGHRLEYAGFRLVRGLLKLLPEPAALGLGSVLGWLVGSILRLRRGVVAENLERAFPEASPGWRRKIAAASYRHLARESVMTFRMSGTAAETVREMTDMVGFQEFREALSAGKGAVVVTGHLGNWEMGAAALAARGVEVDAVVQVQRNRRFDADLRDTREALGIHVVPKQEAPRGVLAALRAGRVAALVADQNVLRAGVFVDFFGVPASTARGPAVFALRTGAPLWAGVAFRIPGGRARYRIVMKPVEVELTGDDAEDALSLTRAHTALLEEWVRECPEQYFWQHKRWKTRPRIPEPPTRCDDITS